MVTGGRDEAACTEIHFQAEIKAQARIDAGHSTSLTLAERRPDALLIDRGGS